MFAWYLTTSPRPVPSHFIPICHSVTFHMLDTASSDVVPGTVSELKLRSINVILYHFVLANDTDKVTIAQGANPLINQ